MPKEFQLASPLPSELEVVLQPWGFVHGWIVDAEGQLVVSGPNVLAFPEGHPPTKLEVFAALRGEPSPATVTRADDRGEFTLRRLETGKTYELLAGGGGFATANSVKTTPGSDVSIRVDAVFGMRLRIEGWPDSKTAIWHPPGPTWTWDPASVGATGLATDSLVAVLVGLHPTEASRLVSNPLAMLFCANTRADAVGPIQLRGTPAGYGPVDRELWAPRVIDAIPELLVEATPRSSQWGWCRVELRGLEPATETDIARQGRLGKIWLAGEGGTFERDFLEWTPSMEIGPIPNGTYAVSLSTESGYVHYPALQSTTTIGADAEMALASFDVRQSCSVELFVANRLGVAQDGECAFEVSQEINGELFSSYASFTRPPYVVQGLVPGRYSFRIFRPFHDPDPISVDLSERERRSTIAFVQR